MSGLIGLPTIIRPWAPLVAFEVSVLVGLVSEVYPPRLDPIEALRHF